MMPGSRTTLPPMSRRLRTRVIRSLGGAVSGVLVVAACSGSGTSAPPEDAIAFTDPQGYYSIEIDPSWERRTDVPSEAVEVWTVAPSSDGFQPNVNILRDAPGGRDLAGYMEFSEANLGSLELVGKAVVKGESGNELGVFEYTGLVPSADRRLHFLAIVSVTDEHAIVATLSTLASNFREIRKDVEPLLRTLRPA